MSAPTVELSMIVKDGASTLKRCLESVCNVVDRIVIGDTGSSDESVAIARSFGAEVVAVPWEKDFARARNGVLQHSRCDWILVLDADEMLDDTAMRKLAEAVARADVFAYDVCIWNYVLETNSRFGEQGVIANPYLVEASRPYPAYGRCVNTRLFRRHPEVFFERSVHENVSQRIQALGLRKAIAPFVIHHFGHAEDSSALRGSKNELYQEIGRAHLQSKTKDDRAYFELGLGELEHYRRPEAALPYFVEALRLNPKDAAAFLFAGVCLLRLGRFAEALELLKESERLDARSIVLQEALGDAHFHLADYTGAGEAYRRALALGSISALVDAKLGASEVHLGRKEEGVARVQRALAREPSFPELYAVASTTALLAGRADLASEIATKRIELGKTIAFDFVLAAALNRAAGDHVRGRALLEQGLSLFPADRELHEALLTEESQMVS